MASLKMKPKQVVKRLLVVLPERARDVIVARFGLGKNSARATLESIGKRYGITRERVRQIENYALNNIRKSDHFKKETTAFQELEAMVHSLGGVVAEKDILHSLANDKSFQNHIMFMLVLGESFYKEKEDDMFHHRWHVDHELSRRVHESIRRLYKSLKDDDIIPEADMVAAFLEHLKDVSEKYKNEEILKRWLSMTKVIGKNPLGEWGLASSPNIKAKGMRDYAFLVLRRHGSPIHFRDVAKLITDLFGKKAHVATTHNELIKDSRFVLVGRGLYALSEWGYVSGVVRDVIRKILEKNGPLTKEEVIDKVLKERYVKENTIVVNLQNQRYFKKDKEGKYSSVI
ncbi:MAG TPA: sigma factor-like helix-turn-helix DNA-binding protein [Candidatus Paceibacterota bacterium]